MKKIITILLLLNTTISFGQAKMQNEPYKFSKEIFSQIEQDTVAWKYQIGATELSFIGRYLDVLRVRDKEGVRRAKTSKEDSLYFINCKKVEAKKYIIEQSKNSQIIIINEAHHISEHRTFTKSLLQDLYNNGYRYLGLEALSDSLINYRKYPIVESGYYTKEPEFGNLIYEALKIGYMIFGYEAEEGKNGKDREIEQAENIQKFLESHPKGKVIIHCGYAHAYENDYPAWGKAMAGRLKENLKIDPLTIDQTMFLEKYEKNNNHLFIRLNNTTQPIVLIDKNKQVFNGFSDQKQTDIVIIPTQTKFINGRPNWITKGKRTYKIPVSKIGTKYPILIFAYRNNEFINNGVPADIIEVTDENSNNTLYLPKGLFTIVFRDQSYNVIDEYKTIIK